MWIELRIKAHLIIGTSFLKQKREKKGLFPSEDIVSEIYTSVQGIW